MPLTPEQQLKKILDYALPITEKERKCQIDMTRLVHKRMELERMIECYRKGIPYVTSPLLIKVDLEKIKQMLAN